MCTRIESNKEEKKIPEVDELDGQRQAVNGVGARVDQHVVSLDVRVHVPACGGRSFVFRVSFSGFHVSFSGFHVSFSGFHVSFPGFHVRPESGWSQRNSTHV